MTSRYTIKQESIHAANQIDMLISRKTRRQRSKHHNGRQEGKQKYILIDREATKQSGRQA